MRSRCLLGLLFLNASVLLAQRSTNGALVGRVLDAQSGTPIVGAELVIPSKDVRATTDSAGRYECPAIAGGVHRMDVRRLGYQQLTLDVSVITGVESESDFRLTRLATLDTVHTKAPATKYISPALTQFEERRKMGNGYFIDQVAMRKNDERTLGNTLKRIPGMRVYLYRAAEYASSSRRAGSGQAGTLMAGGSAPPQAEPGQKDSPRGCWVAVSLDGLALYTGPPQPAPDLSKILVRDLAGAEFYQGSAALPAQFSAIKSSDCGVLLLWTRER